jgi:Gpi18-like mannosyltransferase
MQTTQSGTSPITQPTVWERLRAARWLWKPLSLVAITRLGIALIILFVMPILPQNPMMEGWHFQDNNLKDALAGRWDTGFYLSITDEGYINEGVQFPSVAFFPLYPLTMRLMNLVTGESAWSGLLISNLSLCVAAVLFFRLVSEEFGEKIADRTIWYWLIYPTSFFGSAVYTESFFLMFAIGALYLARRGVWESAGMLGIAATLTRLIGLIVAPMLLVEWFVQWRNRPREERPPLWGALAGLLTPLGTVAYMGFLWYRFGDPIAFVHASEAWAREPRPIWEMVGNMFITPANGWIHALLAGQLPVDNWLDLLIVVFFLSVGVYLLVKRRWSEATFVLLGALIPLNSGLLMSQRRYMWVLFPVFIVMARWGEKEWVDRLITTVSLMLLGIMMALFAEWYWVA